MKTLEDIKEEYARENNFCEWSEILYSIDDPAEIDEHFDKVANLYALEACRETQRMCSERFVGQSHWATNVRESILSESNIPQELRNTISNNG